MEDSAIIQLYLNRDEDAIRQTELAHGAKLYSLSYRILLDREDAEESVSDTYMKAWTTIPPQRPNYFFAYLAKICRFICFGKLDWKNAAKRKAEIISLSDEMQQCIPDSHQSWEPEGEELGKLLEQFMYSLPEESRLIFLRRYWYADSVAEIAQRYGIGESKVKTQLHRVRNRLRTFLEKEGIAI